MEIQVALVWYIFILIIVVAFNKYTLCCSQLNIFTVFLFAFLLNHGIFVPYSINVNDGSFTDFILPEDSKQKWILSLVITYLFLLLGVLVARQMFGKKEISPTELKSQIKSQFFLPQSKPTMPFHILAITLSIATVVTLWQPSLILETLSGDLTGLDYKAHRLAYGEQFSSQSSLWVRFASTVKTALMPLFTYTYFLLQKQSKKNVPAFYFVLTSNVLLGLMSGQKAGLIMTIIGLALTQIISTGKTVLVGRNTFKLFLLGSLLFFVIIPLQYTIQYPTQTYAENLQLVMYRLSGETTRTLQLYFYIYPDIYPHLYGLSSSVFSGLLGIDGILDPSRVVRSYFAFGHASDATGSWNAAFLGSAWADFGYIGVMLQSILVGMLLWYYHSWFVNCSKTPLVIGTYVSITLSCINLAQGNLLTAFLTGGLVSSFLVAKLFIKVPINSAISVSKRL